MNILTAPRSRHALLGAALAATVLFLVAPSPAWSAWEWIGGGKIQAVKAMSPGTVVVAEDGGRVRLVEDYGVLSTPLQTGDGRNLHGMCVLGAQNAWVVGGMGGGCETQVPDDLVDGIILHTADGGAGWTELPNPNLPLERMQFEDVYFTDTMHGVVAGWQHGRVGGGAPRCDVFSINRISSIFVTFDGGATWQVAGRHEAPDSWYTAVDFRNATEGWASRTWTGLGNQDALYGTLDGGVTWTGVPTPVAEGLYDVKATGPLSCVAVGESGTILLTSDGGASWATPTTGVSSLLRGVDFSGTLGFAVGSGGTILRSTDYGVSWGTVASGIATGLRDVSVLSSTEVWAGGEHGALLYSTDGGDSWTVVSQPTTSSTFLDVAATGSGAFAVGYYETALRSDDLGDTWQSVSGFTGHLRTVEFPTATLGWAGGGISGVAHLFRTTDGGLNWDEPAVGDPRNLRDIGFRSPTQGWTVGHVQSDYFTRVRRTTDGGTAWKDATDISMAWGQAGLFVNDLTGFVAGERPPEYGARGRIWRTTDGGTSWTLVHNETAHQNMRYVDMAATDSGTIFAAGLAWIVPPLRAVVLRSTDGGANWHTVYDAEGFSANCLATRGDELWLGCSHGRIVYSADAGDTWSVENSPTTESIEGIALSPDESMAYAVGEEGIRLVQSFGAVDAPDAPLPGTGALAVTAWPNPSSRASWIRVRGAAGEGCVVDIHDVRGRRVHSRSIPGERETFDLRWDGAEGAGVYFVRVTDRSGQVATTKITVLDR